MQKIYDGSPWTNNNIAALIGAAWSHSLTPVNIMAGFRKSGAFPLNPGVIEDRQLAPSLAVRPSTKIPSLSPGSQDSGNSPSLIKSDAPFTPEEEKMYHTMRKGTTYLIHGIQNGLLSTILRSQSLALLW